MSPIKKSSPKSPGKQHAPELKRAHQAAGLLTNILSQPFEASKNSPQQKRLHKVLLAIIGTDTLHPPGQRIVSAGDVRLLEGYEFWPEHPLQQELPIQPQVLLDRQKGYCVLHIPAIDPSSLPTNRSTFTHFLPSAEVVALHFEHETARSFATATTPQAVDAATPRNVFIPFSADSQATLVVAIGLRFLQEQDGILHEMYAGKDPLQIVKVDAGSQSSIRSRESGVGNQAARGQHRESGVERPGSGDRDLQAKVIPLKPDNREQVSCRQGQRINIVPLKTVLDGKAIKKTASKKKSKARKAVQK